MEPLTYKKLYLFTFCILLSLSSWAGGKEKYEKLISQEFPISADGKVHLENKYGDVNVTTGNYRNVKIDIKIIVNANNQEKANATFDRVHIEFNNSKDYVSAITTIGEAKKSWFEWASYDSGGDFQIHYDVQMPISNALELKNKYGNSYVGKLDGKADVEVKYGNLKMEDVNNHLQLMMGYGNGNVGNTKGLSMEVKYSTLHFESTEDVSANTKYSKITLKDAGKVVATTKYDNYQMGHIHSLRNEGKYDHFHIEHLHTIDALSKYTSYKIDVLEKSADLDLEYGGAKFAKVTSGFSSIELEGRYTDYKIYVEQGAKYSLDVESDYAGVRYPTAMQVVHHVEDDSEEELKGYVGGKSSGSIIKAELDYGSIKVEEY